MIRLIILFLSILPGIVLSQETRKIKKQTIYDYEEYYVNKENKNVKNGRYVKLTESKMTL